MNAIERLKESAISFSRTFSEYNYWYTFMIKKSRVEMQYDPKGSFFTMSTSGRKGNKKKRGYKSGKKSASLKQVNCIEFYQVNLNNFNKRIVVCPLNFKASRFILEGSTETEARARAYRNSPSDPISNLKILISSLKPKQQSYYSKMNFFKENCHVSIHDLFLDRKIAYVNSKSFTSNTVDEENPIDFLSFGNLDLVLESWNIKKKHLT